MKRPWADDDREARREFNAALDDGADPEVIIASVKEWVRLADHPRFLPKLSKWLAGRCWQRDPPQRRTRTAAPLGTCIAGAPAAPAITTGGGGMRIKKGPATRRGRSSMS